MVRNALVRGTSVVAFSALPLAAAVVFAGSATGSGDSLLGSVIGALVGYFHPDVVPQVLP